MMLIMVGPSVALNPQYNIEISTCEGDGMGDRSLFFGDYTYENGWRVWEMETTISGLAFWLDGSGAVQYLGDDLETYTERTIQYYLYQVDEFGEPVTGAYEGHTVEVHLNPCAPACPAFVEENSDTSELDGSTIMFTTLPGTRFVDGDGNGDWKRRAYLWTCDGSGWSSVQYSGSMGLPEGAVMEARATNLDAPEVLSAYAYL